VPQRRADGQPAEPGADHQHVQLLLLRGHDARVGVERGAFSAQAALAVMAVTAC
jgi:hypothetical protein